MCRFQWHRFWDCTFRCFLVMGYMYTLSLILLITGLLLEYFETVLKILHLKKISRKCSIFLHWLHFFLMGRSRMFFWIRIKFHLGRAKARGKSGVWGAKPKLRYLFAKFPLLSKIQTWSQRMVVRHTSNHNHCDWHVQKLLCQDFQVILNNSSWSKTTLCIVKEQIWLPNMKCYGKNKLFWFSLLRETSSLSSFFLNTLYRWLTFKWFWAVLPGQKQLCVFLRNRYGFQIWNVMEKINCFDSLS